MGLLHSTNKYGSKIWAEVRFNFHEFAKWYTTRKGASYIKKRHGLLSSSYLT